MGRFFKGKVKKDRTSLIRYGLIGIAVFIFLILFILVIIKSSKPKPNVIIKDNIKFEVNGKKPKKSDIVTVENYDIKNVTIDYAEFNQAAVGSYNIHVSAKGLNDAWVNVDVVDTKAPELTTKDFAIPVGGEYTAADFVETCKDNSKEECNYAFYDASQNQEGEIVDYSSFTEEGTYTIKIVASDNYQNVTEPKDVTLTIGAGGVPKGTNCQYGNLKVSESRLDYPISIIVGDQNTGCALNKDLWDDNEVQKPVNDLYLENFNKLKTDMKDKLLEHYPKQDATITAFPTYIAILNDSYTGLVGYSIYVKLYVHETGTSVKNEDQYSNYLVASYYINSDGTREYEINKYNLK